MMPQLRLTARLPSSLHRKIFEILVRFRAYPVALASDIKKAFLMIQVVTSDQDVLQFLWVKVLSAEIYFHKPITVHLELYLFYHFIHFLLYIGQY